MEFLDINYSEVNEVAADNTLLLNMLNFFIDAGITSKEPVDGMALAAELDQPTQELIQVIIGTKTDPQEKAIVTALINKYKNLDSDKRDIEEFKEHIKNMIESNALGYGSLNYLLERVTSGDVKEKGNKQPEPPAPEQPQAEEGQQAQQEQEQSAPQQGSADTNNSDIMSDKLMEEWDTQFSEVSELTEDDFADILGDSIESLVTNDNEVINAEDSSSPLKSSEEIKKSKPGTDKAKEFLKAKYKGKEVKYSDEDEGFTRAATFLILRNREYSNDVVTSVPNITGLPKVEDSKLIAHKFLSKKVGKSINKSTDNFSAEEFLSSKDKALAFMNSREDIYHTGATLLTAGHKMRADEDNVSDGVSYMRLNKDKSLKTDIRGNLVTALIDKPKLR